MVELATEYGRYGYRRVAPLLSTEGHEVDHKGAERLGRREGLRGPARHPERGRLWQGDGSCVRLRPERKDHVRGYDFARARTRDGRAFRMPNIIDEYSRGCLAIVVARRPIGEDVLERLSDLLVRRGVSGAHPLGQRAGVHGRAGSVMAGRVGVATL